MSFSLPAVSSIPAWISCSLTYAWYKKQLIINLDHKMVKQMLYPAGIVGVE